MKKKHGFSLVEVLLALAVGGLVLMAASSLLVRFRKRGQTDQRPGMRSMHMSMALLIS